MNPFATIQHGIDMASDGDTILVAQGTYSENISVRQKNGIHIKGAGADTTTIDGGRNGHVVVFNVASGSIKGFSIRNSGSNPRYSAGVFTSQANVSIEDNIVVNNHYGITASSDSCVVIQRNQVISNTGWAAIQIMTSSTGAVRNSVIASNMWHGIDGTPSVIVNNTIAGNGSFGVLLMNPSEPIVIRNNIIVRNSCGILAAGGAESIVPLLEISYNDVWNNSGANYWEEYGTIPPPEPVELLDQQPDDLVSRPFDPQPGTGEIHKDPLFADAHYHLQLCSPCIDAGTDADIIDDIDGQTRPHYNGYDQGADEWWPLVAVKTAVPATAQPREAVTYTLTLTNTCEAAMSVRLTDTLQTKTGYLGTLTYTNGSGGYASGVITWTGTVVPASRTLINWTVRITSDVFYSTTITNTATISDIYGIFQTDPAFVLLVPLRSVYLPLVVRDTRDGAMVEICGLPKQQKLPKTAIWASASESSPQNRWD